MGLQGLQAAFLGSLTDVRQALAAPRIAGKEGPGLAELLANVASSILSHIKASLASVHLFTAKEVSFSNKPYFRVRPVPGHPFFFFLFGAFFCSSCMWLDSSRALSFCPSRLDVVSGCLEDCHSLEGWGRL